MATRTAILALASVMILAACGGGSSPTTPGHRRAVLVKPSTVPGAAGVVRIDPKAEISADQGGTKPKGLTAATSCGVERAAVKHLTDGFQLPAPTVMTVDQLVAMAAPPVTASSPRLPQERTLVEIVGAHVIAAKQEADSDLHVIIQTSTGGEMNVEAPQAVCDSSSPYAAQLATARANLDAALGSVSSTAYTPENVTATIEGVLFFDVLHGQRGAANGVELHPVTLFQTGSAPPPPTTTSVTTTAPATTVATTTTAPPRDTDPVGDRQERGHIPRYDTDRAADRAEGL